MQVRDDDPRLDLPFDQYQRYRLIADLCDSLRGPDQVLEVLDVGGRTGVLRTFLPGDRVTIVDLEPSDQAGLVLGSGDRLPFADRSFDVVVASDTLEHVPPERRAAFTRECCRTTRAWVLLAGPYEHPAVSEAEELLQRFLVDRLGERHRYLEEHRALGLPGREEVAAWCRAAGAREVTSVSHGNLERWLGLMSLALYLDADAPLRPAARRLNRFYNALLHSGDRRGIAYRHVLVAAFGQAPLPAADRALAPADLPPEALAPFGHLLADLAGFDVQRDVVRAERERLAGEVARARADVAGHARALAERGADLAGHKERVAELERDLAGHRARLAETEQDLDEHRAALRQATGELEAHRSALGAVRAELDGIQLERAELLRDLELQRVVAAELRADAEALRDHSGALVREIETVRAEARAIEAELLRKTRWRRRFWRALGR